MLARAFHNAESTGCFFNAPGKVVQVLARGEDNVLENLAGEQILKIAHAESLGKGAVVGTGEKRAPADDGKLALGVHFDRHGETVQTGMAPIMHHTLRLKCALMSYTAEGIAQVDVIGRRLKRPANGIVV